MICAWITTTKIFYKNNVVVIKKIIINQIKKTKEESVSFL